MASTDRTRLRGTFDQAAELYDRARPGYPPALFEDLAELAGVGPGCRVLEIGPGTGQATVPLAERGCHIVAVELGVELATIATHHVAGGDEAFFVEVQACYERWDPDTPPGLRLPAAAAVPASSRELDRSGRFGPVTFRRHEWELEYISAGYVDVLRTYSGHRALEAVAQANLLACIAELIDTRFGGQISKRYLTELQTARTQRPSRAR
jgi:hypothetical protein